MSLRFLAFSQSNGFTDSWPMETMAKVMGDLAKKNPQGTINDVPGPVAFLWDRSNKTDEVILDTDKGRLTQEVKPGGVVWLQAGTDLSVTRSDGTTQHASVTSNVTCAFPSRPREHGLGCGDHATDGTN